MSDGDQSNNNARMLSDEEGTALRFLADEIRKELHDLGENDDAIQRCGKAALSILPSRPLEALQLAKDHVQYQPYRDVQRCWLRLYEDASLWRAAELLCDAAEGRLFGRGETSGTDDWMSYVIRVLDLGLIVSGGTLRGELYEAVFANLEPFVEQLAVNHSASTSFHVEQPKVLDSEHLVPTSSEPSLEDFQLHLDSHTTPLLLTGVIDGWPAMSTWQDPSHLLRLTLGGRRCVPIEIGETYTHADWRQEIMPFRKFMRGYLLPNEPREIGYLGQHNLFHQIPALQREIRTPDYCFSAPPETTPASRLGLPHTPPVDEPQKNVWLGPRGTRTPLHTDPYHNIFCQVLGYKYVRLYPPEATESVYPRGVDDNGINESNTSTVEIKFDPEISGNVAVEDGSLFPQFGEWRDYREAIVGPGECLYIPAGWWHYIESLTTSYSNDTVLVVADHQTWNSFAMICERCKSEFFSVGTKDSLLSGKHFSILSWVLYAPSNTSCTICSTALNDAKDAVLAHSQRLGEASKRWEAKEWYREIKTWPSLPIRVERRVGRLSFIIGPCSAEFALQDGTTWTGVRVKARLFIMTPRTNGAERILGAQGAGTDSEESIKQAKDWLEACNDPNKHKECSMMAEGQKQRRNNSGQTPFVPTRLLEVGTEEKPIIRLVGNTQKESVTGPYTTISHMWGIHKDDRFQLTSANYGQFCKAIDGADPNLTLTFRQGMHVTRCLGVRYVWIDSICINQGDAKDFFKESATMEQIYRNSYCNIAAVDSEDGSQGLFRKRCPEDLPPDIVKFDNREYSIMRPDFWNQQVLSGPLYARGWVLQERILAPRVLHFAREQIFWQCPSLTACESSPSGLPISVHGEDAKLELMWRRALHQDRLAKLEVADLNAMWKHIVYSYTRCNLSSSGDKLIALSGVAKAMQRGLEENFLAGLWDSVLPENRELANLGDQLCWTVENGKNIKGGRSTRYEKYQAPSWSWASLDGIITLRNRIIEHNPVSKLSISEAKVTLQDKIWATGPVWPEGTELRLNALTLRMTFYATANGWNRLESQYDSRDGDFTCHALLDDCKDLVRMRDEKESISTDVALLACGFVVDSGSDGLYAGRGLVLRHNGDTDETYLRVGCVMFKGISKHQWEVMTEGSMRRDIVLV